MFQRANTFVSIGYRNHAMALSGENSDATLSSLGEVERILNAPSAFGAVKDRSTAGEASATMGAVSIAQPGELGSFELYVPSAPLFLVDMPVLL